jgi:hypothetical protein
MSSTRWFWRRPRRRHGPLGHAQRLSDFPSGDLAVLVNKYDGYRRRRFEFNIRPEHESDAGLQSFASDHQQRLTGKRGHHLLGKAAQG